MTTFSSELSGSLIFNSSSTTAELQPYSGGLNVSGSELFINRVGLDTRISAVESGFVGSASLGPLNIHSGSVNTFSASTNLRVGTLESSSAAVNTTTGSLSSQVSSLRAATSSYATKTGQGLISSSTQISASGFLTSQSAAASGFGSGGSTPAGTISGSSQIEALGFITASATASYVAGANVDGTVTSSLSASVATTATTANTASFIADSFISASAVRSGFGAGTSIPAGTVSGSSQIEDLGFITSSNVNTASFVQNSATASFITADQTSSFGATSTGSLIQTASVSNNTITFTKGDSTTFNLTVATGSGGGGGGDISATGSNSYTGSNLFTGSVAVTGSLSINGDSLSTYDGNRRVSNTSMGDLFSASFNPGTSGSIVDFLNAMFFPNTAPTISTGNQTISEFTTSGSSIVTVTGTDPEGQSLTFGTSSAYTDDFVRVSGSGEMTLNVLATGSMNTQNRGDGELAHPIILRAVDTFGAAVTKTIYLTITLNTAPVFRESSIGGNIITAFSSSRNESATSGEVTKIYFTDAESDAITITSQSDANNHFIFQRTGSYVRLLQNTGSLDFETTSSYSLSLTASDEHSVAGVDGNSFTTLPVTVTVVDNATPTINPQTITGVTESVASGTSAGNVSANDTEGNTLTFGSFTLAGLKIDGSDISLATYGGTGKNDPTENAFQMNSAGNVTLRNGVFLNSDLINSYVYSASVSDAFNNAVSASVTIPIVDDQAATISGTTSLYIIESAVTGDGVKTNTDGRSGLNARFTADQAVTWSISSSNDYNIDTSGYVTIARNISGSSDVGGGQLVGRVTSSNAFGTTSSLAFTVNITDNVAPNITFTDTSANLNTNGARSGSTITTISFNDTEGDDVDLTSFNFTDPSGQLNTVQAGGTFLVQPTNNLSGSSYGFTASIADTGSFETRTSTHDVTITSAPIGSGSSNGDFFIFESAVSGANIVLNTNGRTGTQGDINVTYSPQFNSAAVQSFTSSNSAIAISSIGNISLNTNLSGSTTSSGDTISSTITYQDQFSNIGSSSISVSVALNSLPTASFTNQTSKFNTNLGTTGTTLVSASITDVESDTPYSASLSGLSGSAFTIQFNNANSSSFEIKAANNLTAGDYPYTASVFDNFAKSNEYNRTITIAQSTIGSLVSSSNFFIIESATNGATVRANADGRTGTAADVNVNYSPDYGSQAVQSFTSSNAQLAVNASGNITIGFALSGSGTASGDTISSNLTFRDQYDNIGSGSITVTVATNNAPDIIFSDTSGNQNTNLARSGSTLVTLTFSDTESDTINYAGVTFQNTGSQLNLIQDGTSWLVQAKENLSASVYSYTASVQDQHQFNTNTENDSFTIAAADIGTLSTNGTFYVIESAVSGADVVTNSNGRTGTQADVGVSYSPNYGSAVVQSFTSSNAQVAITNAGAISLNQHISGSGTGSGDTISSTITFRDQYDNIGSGSISINVTENAAPTVVSFTDITSNMTASVAVGTDLVSMSISDTESNTPFSASLGGANASDLTFQYNNSDSSSAFIEAATTLAAGTYNYNVTVHDNFGKSTTYSGRSFTVAAQPYLVYLYGFDGGTPASEAAAFGTLGDTGGDGVGVTSGSVIAMFESGALGTTFSDSLVSGDCELVTSASLTRLNNDNTADTGSGIASFGTIDFSADAQIALILFPSASVVDAKPSSMFNGVLPNGSATAGEYALFAKDTTPAGVISTAVYYFDLENPHLGYSNWGMILQTGQNNNVTRYYMVPSSGSAPS